MRITIMIESREINLDLMDAIHNAMQDDGIRQEIEDNITSIIEGYLRRFDEIITRIET